MGFMRRKRLAGQQGESNTSAFHAGNLYKDVGAIPSFNIRVESSIPPHPRIAFFSVADAY